MVLFGIKFKTSTRLKALPTAPTQAAKVSLQEKERMSVQKQLFLLINPKLSRLCSMVRLNQAKSALHYTAFLSESDTHP